MGTAVALTEPSLAVAPGASVTTEMRVRNTGSVVDQFAFQPLGDAAAWIKVEPASVRLFPDTDEVVTVSISPPRDSSSRPGISHWAVKVVPNEHPDEAAVAEGTVDVAEFVEFTAELQPTTGHGRLAGRYDVAIDNRGNVPLPIRFEGTTAEQSLEFDFRPMTVETAPGEAHFVKLKARPDKRMWRGQPKSHAFQLLVEPVLTQAPVGEPVAVGAHGAPSAPPPPGTPPAASPVSPRVEPLVLTGTLLQVAIIPKWLWKALVLLLVLLAALWILWKTLVKPTVESAARAIAVEEVEEVEEALAEVETAAEETAGEVAALEENVAEVEEAVDAGAGGADGGAAGGDDGGGGGPLDGVFNETTTPSNFRLAVTADPGGTAGDTADPLAADSTFALTDIVLQNPDGDSGDIAIEISGAPIIETSLENFRTLDFHFVAPYVIDSSTPLSISVVCDVAPEQADACNAAVSFSGYQTVTTPTAGE